VTDKYWYDLDRQDKCWQVAPDCGFRKQQSRRFHRARRWRGCLEVPQGSFDIVSRCSLWSARDDWSRGPRHYFQCSDFYEACKALWSWDVDGPCLLPTGSRPSGMCLLHVRSGVLEPANGANYASTCIYQALQDKLMAVPLLLASYLDPCARQMSLNAPGCWKSNRTLQGPSR
jgi:hypothetical protein